MLGIYYDDAGANSLCTLYGETIPLVVNDEKRYVTHKYNGCDVLTFEIETINNKYRYIAEEVKIRDESNKYIVKKIDEHSDFVVVECDLDLDDWKGWVFKEFREVDYFENVLKRILPYGWTVKGSSGITSKITVEQSEGEPMLAVTPLEVLDRIADVYECVFNFDCLEKILKVVDIKSFEPSGDIYTDEINLKSIGFTGNSSNFATRLYAYGKENEETGERANISSINGGKEYIDNFSYSNKIISVGWSDERYTRPDSLLAAAKKKLEELSLPVRSYTCDVINLNQNIHMYKIITIIDRRRMSSIEHMVIEYKEYPRHDLDVVTLSAASPSIERSVDNVSKTIQKSVAKSLSTQKVELQTEIVEEVQGAKAATNELVNDYDDYLDSEVLLDRLTNEGERPVLFERNGTLYVNSTYIDYNINIIENTDIVSTDGKVKLIDFISKQAGAFVTICGTVEVDKIDKKEKKVFKVGDVSDKFIPRYSTISTMIYECDRFFQIVLNVDGSLTIQNVGEDLFMEEPVSIFFRLDFFNQKNW